MHSSTSSSEPRYDPRLYDRALPGGSLGPAAIVAVAVMLFGMGAWEMYWRANDAVPSYRNSAGLWAIQRRRIDEGEGGSTVVAGSSRMLFIMQLVVWEEESGT